MFRSTRLLPLLSVALLTATIACTPRSPRHDEAVDAAAQAALRIARTNHLDTLALQRAIIDARAQRSRFVLQGDSLAAADYDCTLHDSLYAHDPQLARSIFPQ